MCAVAGSEDNRAELLRKFEEAISGAELDDLRSMLGNLGELAGRRVAKPTRPDLRRPPLDEVVVYRVRVDLDGAKPPIWRRLDIRSDLTLDVVHQVLQTAFEWSDSHLHRFSVGGHPFDRHSQLFLCPFDVEEGAEEDEGGIPTGEVRLDQVVQEPGDVVRYVYDYGDSWEHTLRLEKVLPGSTDAPAATCVDGRRAAPPEDSGGLVAADDLARLVDDPAHFDVDEVNRALQAPRFLLGEYGVHPGLADLVGRLTHTEVGDDLAARMVHLVSLRAEPLADDMRAALRAHQWFLDRAHGAGIELTSAGYLKPTDVEAAALVVPGMAEWIGKNNRESHAAPLLRFRESLQSMGLLRKRKGRLLLTRVGAAAREDPVKLWRHLASRLVPDEGRGFESAATLLLLAYAASAVDGTLPLDDLATALRELGWQHQDGSAVEGYEAFHLDAFTVLSNVTADGAETDEPRVSAAAAALARTALRQAS